MSPYLQRLLTLLHSAAQKGPYGNLAVSEAWKDEPTALASPPYIRLDELLGVPVELFPSAHRLADEDLTLFTAALLHLWRAFRLYPAFPEHLPNRRQYELLVGRMGGLAMPYFGEQGTYVEFCWYDPADCPFGSEFCECKNWVRDREAVYECGSLPPARSQGGGNVMPLTVSIKDGEDIMAPLPGEGVGGRLLQHSHTHTLPS